MRNRKGDDHRGDQPRRGVQTRAARAKFGKRGQFACRLLEESEVAGILPFNKPFIAGKELYYIAQAVVDGQLSGGGFYTKLCHQWFEEHLGCRKALLTHSCTAALEMAAILCDTQPGDAGQRYLITSMS